MRCHVSEQKTLHQEFYHMSPTIRKKLGISRDHQVETFASFDSSMIGKGVKQLPYPYTQSTLKELFIFSKQSIVDESKSKVEKDLNYKQKAALAQIDERISESL
mmetsp:Transcript_33229/g.50939  ORF Transcript_33229/g.50939 Transcript_33229/m.50939 type:complete len:104 (+) Transcript_33229:7383-7694(+)